METTLTLRRRLGFHEVSLWKQFCARRLHLIHTLSLNLRKASEQDEQVRVLAAELCAEYGFSPKSQPDFEKLLIAGIQSVRRNQKRSSRNPNGNVAYAELLTLRRASDESLDGAPGDPSHYIPDESNTSMGHVVGPPGNLSQAALSQAGLSQASISQASLAPGGFGGLVPGSLAPGSLGPGGLMSAVPSIDPGALRGGHMGSVSSVSTGGFSGGSVSGGSVSGGSVSGGSVSGGSMSGGSISGSSISGSSGSTLLAAQQPPTPSPAAYSEIPYGGYTYQYTPTSLPPQTTHQTTHTAHQPPTSSHSTHSTHGSMPLYKQDGPMMQSLMLRIEVLRGMVNTASSMWAQSSAPELAQVSAEAVITAATAAAAVHGKLSSSQIAAMRQSVMGGSLLEALRRALNPALSSQKLLERIGVLAASLVHGPNLLAALQSLFVSLAHHGSLENMHFVLEPLALPQPVALTTSTALPTHAAQPPQHTQHTQPQQVQPVHALYRQANQTPPQQFDAPQQFSAKPMHASSPHINTGSATPKLPQLSSQPNSQPNSQPGSHHNSVSAPAVPGVVPSVPAYTPVLRTSSVNSSRAGAVTPQSLPREPSRGVPTQQYPMPAQPTQQATQQATHQTQTTQTQTTQGQPPTPQLAASQTGVPTQHTPTAPPVQPLQDYRIVSAPPAPSAAPAPSTVAAVAASSAVYVPSAQPMFAVAQGASTHPNPEPAQAYMLGPPGAPVVRMVPYPMPQQQLGYQSPAPSAASSAANSAANSAHNSESGPSADSAEASAGILAKLAGASAAVSSASENAAASTAASTAAPVNSGLMSTGPDRLVKIQYNDRVLEMTYSPLKAEPPTISEIVENARKSFAIPESTVVRVRYVQRNKIIETNAELIDAFNEREVNLELLLPPPMLVNVGRNDAKAKFTPLAPIFRASM